MINKIERLVARVTRFFSVVAACLLVLLMLLGAVDVLGRLLFATPIQGTIEVSGLLLAGIVFFGLAGTMAVDGHVSVDIFTSRFSDRKQSLFRLAGSIPALLVYLLMGWQALFYAHRSYATNTMVDVLYIPLFPFQVMVALGIFAFCLELALYLGRQLRAVKGTD